MEAINRTKLRSVRGIALVSTDAASWLLASSVVLNRLGANDPTSLAGAAAIALGAVGGNAAVRNYSVRWMVGEFKHVLWHTLAAAAPAVMLLALSLPTSAAASANTLLAAIAAASLAHGLTSAARVGWRLYWTNEDDPEIGEPVVIFGAGNGARLLLSSLRAGHSTLNPVALLDDDPTLVGRRIGSLSVIGGREALGRAIAATGAKRMVVAIPSAPREVIRELTAHADGLGVTTSVLPSMAELVGRAISHRDVRDVTPEDLLGRQPVEMDLPSLGSYVTDRTVLVTGAGGSIGSELSRQLARLNPARLLMLDRDESALHALQLSLDGRGQLDDAGLIVADIRDLERLDELFAIWRPDVVFHAAALKHLPLLDRFPAEGVKTNVVGSQNLIELACKHNVDRFVNVSTDKAADPTSVLGWTKRLAERLTAQAADETGRGFISVRFGNVLGSRGSVLEAFSTQIAAGGPVTVTHPEITRYFMTVEEAASLVIAAGAVGDPGDVMILEMGEPVRILEVARQMIALSGRDVDIEITGLRANEKLHEVLQSHHEAIVKTDDGLMWRGRVEPMSYHEVERELLGNEDLHVALRRAVAQRRP